MAAVRPGPGWLLFLVLSLLLLASPGWTRDPAYEPDPLGPEPVSEIRAFCHSPGPGGPVSRRWLIRLDVYNRRNVSVWYLVRWRTERPLPQSVHLAYREPLPPSSIACRVFDGSAHRGWGRLVLVEIPCPGGPLQAFRLPARGYLRMADFEVESAAPPEIFEIWETSALTVNGYYSLEDWLPFDSLSGIRVWLRPGTPGSDFAAARRWKIDRLMGAPELTPARQISVTVLRKWLLPLRLPPR